ncbi:MAG: hypothetical protein JNK05_36190 [Myxococcales bacterium]|nr:hypothetical protein [Myxococcales bacterium]
MNNELPGDEPNLDPSATPAPEAPTTTAPVAEAERAPIVADPSAFSQPPVTTSSELAAAIEPPVSEDEARFRAMCEAVRAPADPKKPHTLTLVLLAMLGFGWLANSSDSMSYSIALLVALALNQLGHSFAMRGFGYSNRSIIFIPFYGSVSTGTKEDATPTQRAIVQLMGPLPGIVLGTVLSFTAARFVAPGHFLHHLVPVLLIMNLFQLLPFPSFTGGELLRLLALRRNRWLDFAFRGVLGALLVYAAAQWKLVILAVIAVVSLVRLPADWRTRVAADSIRKRFGAISPLASELSEEVLRAVYDHAEVLTAKFPEPQRSTQRTLVARELIRLASEQSPSGAVSVALLGATGALFVLGSIAYVLFSAWLRPG